MNRFLRILIAAVLMVGLVGPLSTVTTFAQTPAGTQAASTTGAVQGTVHDSNGNPIADVSITMKGAATLTTRSDAKGTFSFANVTPGIYAVTATKPGFDTATDPAFGVLAGEVDKLDVVMNAISFSSLRTIANISTRATGSRFNPSTASVQVVTAQNYQDQAQTQVMRILDETPGIVTGHPNGTANQASPGAIQIPNIRGGLSFETSSLIDGHPLSVGRFGNYVISFLDSSVFQSTELVKGPGANVPTINYAIGGTVNFKTWDPTATPTGEMHFGIDSYGGYENNLRYSNTLGKFGLVLDFARQDTPGPINPVPTYAALPSGATIVGTDKNGNPVTGILKCATGFTAFGCSSATPPTGYTGPYPNPNAQNSPTSLSYTPYVGCCYNMTSHYATNTELFKLRYSFSSATQFTASFLGSQADVDQDGNTFQQQVSTFTPGASFSGAPIGNGSQYLINFNAFRPATHEVNNEPIFQGEFRTSINKDTLLARYYSASINRLLTNPLNGPTQPWTVGGFQLYGTACIVPTASASCTAANTKTFTGQNVTVTENGQYFEQNEEDRLHGLSFQYTHPIGENAITLGYDKTFSTTRYTTGGSGGWTINIPDGSGQTMQTFLARGYWTSGKANVTFSNYFNNYKTHYAVFSATSLIGGPVNYTFQDANTSHYDPRIGLEFRSSPNLSLRFAAGSAIAPPYINLWTANNQVSYRTGGSSATQTLPNPNLVPETAFGYNAGADYRLKGDPATIVSGDVYMENLFNQFITQNYQNGNCTNTTPNVAPNPCPATGVPLYVSQSQNIANGRYEGLELSIRRDPAIGTGFALQGALIKAYPYNLPPNFYQSGGNQYGTNLGVIPGINFQAGGSGFNSVSNQSIPYSSGYAELHHRFVGGYYASVGWTYYGHNNSYNIPAFGVLNATLRGSFGPTNGVTWQITGDNLTNIWPNTWITAYGGSPDSLANGKIGLTNANTVGPRRFRFIISKSFGGNP